MSDPIEIPVKDLAEPGSRLPHRIAALLALIVFPLIWLGGLVTTYDAGMAVPDWPGTYGYNMFLYPIETWLFGPFDLLVEHGHRLLAAFAGLIAIVLVVATFRTEKRRWVKWFSVSLLALVILQGALGGFRVLFDARVIAKIHGCVGPAFFVSVVAFCVVTSRWWHRMESQPLDEKQLVIRKGFGRFAVLMLAVSFAQLVIGAFIRHIDVDAGPSSFVLLVAMHIVTASVIVLGTLVQWALTRRPVFRGSGIRFSGNIVALLVLMQFTLGLTTWVMKYGWPAWFADSAFAASYVIGEKTFMQMNIVTLHQAVGSLILAFYTLHALRCRRLATAAERTRNSTEIRKRGKKGRAIADEPPVGRTEVVAASS